VHFVTLLEGPKISGPPSDCLDTSSLSGAMAARDAASLLDSDVCQYFEMSLISVLQLTECSLESLICSF